MRKPACNRSGKTTNAALFSCPLNIFLFIFLPCVSILVVLFSVISKTKLLRMRFIVILFLLAVQALHAQRTDSTQLHFHNLRGKLVLNNRSTIPFRAISYTTLDSVRLHAEKIRSFGQADASSTYQTVATSD